MSEKKISTIATAQRNVNTPMGAATISKVAHNLSNPTTILAQLIELQDQMSLL